MTLTAPGGEALLSASSWIWPAGLSGLTKPSGGMASGKLQRILRCGKANPVETRGGGFHVKKCFLRTMGSRALLHRYEAAFAAHAKAAYAFAAGGGNRAFDGVAFKTGNGPDDSDAAYPGDDQPGLRRGHELFLLGTLAAHAFDHAQVAFAGRGPRP